MMGGLLNDWGVTPVLQRFVPRPQILRHPADQSTSSATPGSPLRTPQSFSKPPNTAGFDINVIVLLFRFPTLIVPVLIIAWIKFTSSVWLIGNSGTVVRGTARPGTRETPRNLLLVNCNLRS
jgi:hypothetical protein